MENKINITELLRNCPEGMELDCTIWDNVTLGYVCKSNSLPICIRIPNNGTIFLSKYGQLHDDNYCKCVIFPKGKTTWEGFQRPFKNGDVIYTESFIAIFSHITEDGEVCYHCYYYINTKKFKAKRDFGIGNINYDEFRIATADEKAKLFQVIKDNGYKWNPETKTLEKVPKIKDGDIIYTKTRLSEWVSIFEKFDYDECKCYIDYCIDSDTYYGEIGGKKNPLCEINDIVEQRLATEDEKQKLFDVIKENGHRWNSKTNTLEKLIEPKFKVGDRIVDNSGLSTYVIKSVSDEYYGLELLNGTVVMPVKHQDDWELDPKEIYIPTLKPFDKVLVRDSDKKYWSINLFGFYNKKTKEFHCMGNSNIGWNKCIPYEGNEHLLGTTNDCDEFYKIW